MRTRRSASSSSDPVPSRDKFASAIDGPNGKKSLSHAKAKEGEHQSVLLHESIAALNIKSGDVILDATLGGGGHARAIAERLGEGVLVGIDADNDAVERAKQALSNAACRVCLETNNFRNLADVLQNCGVSSINSALFDLGWSGYQRAAGRGFSFLADEPLLMTYAKEIRPNTLTAEKIVNDWGEGSIADVLYGWGEERYARKIARKIAQYRKKKRITTSKELGEIISSAVSKVGLGRRIHPATKSFQALRIAVNDELGALRDGLNAAFEKLVPGGRIVVITFHSVEDRVVKQMMQEWELEEKGMRMARSPSTPTREEVQANPRARSAKLRVFEKT